MCREGPEVIIAGMLLYRYTLEATNWGQQNMSVRKKVNSNILMENKRIRESL